MSSVPGYKNKQKKIPRKKLNYKMFFRIKAKRDSTTFINIRYLKFLFSLFRVKT